MLMYKRVKKLNYSHSTYKKNIEHNNMIVTNNSPRKYEKGN